jgi:hypothetical protein
MLSQEQRREILSHMQANENRFAELTPRTLHKIGMLRLSTFGDNDLFERQREALCLSPARPSVADFVAATKLRRTM